MSNSNSEDVLSHVVRAVLYKLRCGGVSIAGGKKQKFSAVGGEREFSASLLV